MFLFAKHCKITKIFSKKEEKLSFICDYKKQFAKNSILNHCRVKYNDTRLGRGDQAWCCDKGDFL